MTRYVVIGAGAIGALLAAQFRLTGIDTVRELLPESAR